ncbi:NAD(P)/FAD-dependent oxidoreductase [Algicella marina]|uniref:NAD(P)/FAD-dependent oxidoreductase n=1 Tax=Algicella marina TaxID=2683284 RepID=UPI0024DF465C|nr:FAD-binding oxidoreductase [Algicella marina]
MATRKSDVIIVGAGIFGLSVAFALLQRGMAVVVLEARQIGAGASGGIVGALSPHAPERWNEKKEFQLKSLFFQQNFWREVQQASNMETTYARTGRLLPLPTLAARELAIERSRGAAEHWQGRADWQLVDTADGWLASEIMSCGCVRETLSARLFPSEAIESLAAAVRALGGEIVEETAVETIENGRVYSSSADFQASSIVVAAGVAGFDLLKPLVGSAPGSGVKGQAALLAAPATGREPLLFYDGVYIVPHGDNRVAVGSTSENRFDDAGNTDERLDSVIDTAQSLCPKLRAAKVLTRWAGVRPKARKRDPMLGPVPGHSHVFVALGGFKIGFGIAPFAGKILADMIAGRSCDLPRSFGVESHMEI